MVFKKSEADVLIGAIESVKTQLARSFLIDFIEYNDPLYTVKWFHERICNVFDEVLKSKYNKVMVFVPPQHGKSRIISEAFPAFALGQYPKYNVVSCSYSADLAQKFNRKVQRIIDSPLYKDLFPLTRLNSKNVSNDSKGSWLRNTEVFEIVGYGGTYKAVGVEGPLTGNPVDIGIIDDPIKDAVEAQSKITRQRVWEWYNDVFNTRCHNKSKQIIVMTRWNEDDLAGRLLSTQAGQWKVVSLPALREDDSDKDDPREIDEPLWPERFSKELIMRVKRDSARTFTSLYQQRPAPSEGGLFLRSWFKFYNVKTDTPVEFDSIIQSWDCTFKDAQTSDFVVGQVWGKVGANAYLIDMVRGKWSFTETLKQVALLSEKYPNTDAKYVEDKANGTAVIDTLKEHIPGIIPVSPTESKESRASAVSYVLEAGNVYFPADEPWTVDYIEELAVFPNGKHDDMVDATTQALAKLYKGLSMPGLFVV